MDDVPDTSGRTAVIGECCWEPVLSCASMSRPALPY